MHDLLKLANFLAVKGLINISTRCLQLSLKLWNLALKVLALASHFSQSLSPESAAHFFEFLLLMIFEFIDDFIENSFLFADFFCLWADLFFRGQLISLQGLQLCSCVDIDIVWLIFGQDDKFCRNSLLAIFVGSWEPDLQVFHLCRQLSL